MFVLSFLTQVYPLQLKRALLAAFVLANAFALYVALTDSVDVSCVVLVWISSRCRSGRLFLSRSFSLHAT
jgi:hypothetical protein